MSKNNKKAISFIQEHKILVSAREVHKKVGDSYSYDTVRKIMNGKRGSVDYNFLKKVLVVSIETIIENANRKGYASPQLIKEAEKIKSSF